MRSNGANMEPYVTEGDRATFRFRPAVIPGGGCLIAAAFCGLNSLISLLKVGGLRDLLQPLGLLIIFGNLLMALVGAAGLCVISTVVIDKSAQEVVVTLALVPPYGLPVKMLSRSVYHLFDFKYVELNPNLKRRSTPTLNLCGENDSVQLLGSYFPKPEFQKIGETLADWLEIDFKIR